MFGKVAPNDLNRGSAKTANWSFVRANDAFIALAGNIIYVWKINRACKESRNALQNGLSPMYKHTRSISVTKSRLPRRHERECRRPLPIHSLPGYFTIDYLREYPGMRNISRSLFMCNVISAIAAVRAPVSFVFYVRIVFRPARGGAKALTRNRNNSQ